MSDQCTYKYMYRYVNFSDEVHRLQSSIYMAVRGYSHSEEEPDYLHPVTGNRYIYVYVYTGSSTLICAWLISVQWCWFMSIKSAYSAVTILVTQTQLTENNILAYSFDYYIPSRLSSMRMSHAWRMTFTPYLVGGQLCGSTLPTKWWYSNCIIRPTISTDNTKTNWGRKQITSINKVLWGGPYIYLECVASTLTEKTLSKNLFWGKGRGKTRHRHGTPL